MKKENPKAKTDLLVFISGREGTCAECGEKLERGSWVTLQEDRQANCLSCSDLDHLVFLPSGDAALTRRSRKHSGLSAVVLKWSRARKRNERQGLLVENAAIEKAEEECQADAGLRERRRGQAALRRAELDEEFLKNFAARIRELYPHCPAGRDQVIAEHACRKYSGRVGRSAAAKDLAEKAVELAVRAHIRHAETNYDDLMQRGVSRAEARSIVKSRGDDVLRAWREGKD